MRKLRVHPNLGVADLVERRRDGSADAVAGQLILVAHPFQGGVEGVLADALLEVAAMRQQVLLGRPHHPQEVAQDLDGLEGQRHDVGRHILRALAGLAHLVLKLLDDLRRDDPQTTVEVELIRGRQPQFAGAHPGQEQQPDAELGLPAARVVEPELLEKFGKLGQMQVRVMVHRRFGLRHHVQVRSRIGFHTLDNDQSIAEQLSQPGADLFSGSEGLALLDPCQDTQKLGPANVVDRHPPKAGQHVLVEDTEDLGERALPTFLEFLAAMLDPGVEDRLEGVIGSQFDRMPFLLAVGVGVDALGQQRPGLVAQGTSLAQADLRVVAQGDALLFAEPVVAQVPRLAAGRGDHQAEAVGVGDAVGFVGGLSLPHSQIRECHHRAPKLRLRLNARHGSPPTPATIRNLHPPHSLASILASKTLAVGGFPWLLLE